MRSGSNFKAGLVLTAAAFTSAGCYSSVPMASYPPGPGTDVVARLTMEGQKELAHLVGPRVVSIEGRVLSADADTLRLRVSATNSITEDVSFWKGEPLSIARPFVALLEKRTLSPVRTAGIAGILVAAAFAIRSSVGQSGGGRKGGGGPPVGQ